MRQRTLGLFVVGSVVLAIVGVVSLREISRRRSVGSFEAAQFYKSHDALKQMGEYVAKVDSYEAFVAMFQQDYDLYTPSPGHPLPIPYMLPNGQIYNCITSVPRGADRSEVPFMWDTAPSPWGTIAVLFWDGTVGNATKEFQSPPASERSAVTPEQIDEFLDRLTERSGGVRPKLSTGKGLRSAGVLAKPSG